MATFVLVHGGFFGGWCYRRVARLLRAADQEVYTPTLTGLGERSHLLTPDVDLETHIQDIANVILWEDLQDIVLCGHSYGGMVITGVADLLFDRIQALVYIDAIVPEDGDSLLDRLPPNAKKIISEQLAASASPFVTPVSSSAWVNANDQSWVDSKCTSQPKAAMTQRIHLTGAYLNIPRRVFIYAGGGAHEARHRQFSERPRCTVRAIENSGHGIMVDQPEHLAAALLECTVSATRSTAGR
jgi:pimeloyl-ACP methyl ester carboxylesterase